MKRYLLFGFDQYYPSGGLSDLLGDFDTLEDARKHVDSKNWKCDFYEVLDMEIGQEVDLP